MNFRIPKTSVVVWWTLKPECPKNLKTTINIQQRTAMFNVTQRIKLKRTSVLFLLFLIFFLSSNYPSYKLYFHLLCLLWFSGLQLLFFVSQQKNCRLVVPNQILSVRFFIECRVSQSVRPSVLHLTLPRSVVVSSPRDLCVK